MKIRSVKPEFWSDEILANLPRGGRLTFLGLWNFCDSKGLFKGTAKSVKAKLYSHDSTSISDINSWLEGLEKNGFIKLLPNDIQILNFKKNKLVGDLISERPSIPGWKALREKVFKRDNYTCKYCGIKAKDMHCDHVIPLSRGGSNELNNLVTACQKCNITKGNRTHKKWGHI